MTLHLNLASTPDWLVQKLIHLCADGGRNVESALVSMMGLGTVGADDAVVESGHFNEAGAHLLAGDDGAIVARFDVQGDVTGELLQLIPVRPAGRVVAALLGRDTPSDLADGIAEEDQQVLAEVANIVASTFLNALADGLKCVAIPTVPEVYWLAAADIESTLSAFDAGANDTGISIWARLERSEVSLNTAVVLRLHTIPAAASAAESA
jgi:chemotaxis protein CheY-P-specific phosphatase CheC